MKALLKVSSPGWVLPKIRIAQDNTASGNHECPCCSYKLLRHISKRGSYWRCSHCYQEMPLFLPITQISSSKDIQDTSIIY